MSESPHPLKNFRPLKTKNKSVADKKVPVSILENFATNARKKQKQKQTNKQKQTKNKLPTANCVIVIVTRLVIVVSIQMSRPEKLGAEN